ncbi:MAG: threonylcarbamoyl-AMP synthase [Clostridia bacterium]|nr:threonylcarbamoyl-AMP synthase [Clostridia bacterium]
METRLITVDSAEPDEELLAGPARTVREGGLVIFPTETVYGIGSDATNPSASKKIYAAKGRPSDNPLIVHIASPEDAENIAVTSPLYYRLAGAFMPGPLTVILEKKDVIPFETTGGLPTVALRCPSHPVARALIRLAGVPVAAPSANVSGRPSATDAATAFSDFRGKADWIIGSGDAVIGLESTIVKPTSDDSLLLLRPGAVTADELGMIVSRVEIAGSVEGVVGPDERPVCPGMKYRHYAPAKPLTLVSGPAEDRAAFLAAAAADGAAVICYEEQADVIPRDRRIVVGKENDLAAQAQRLFSALRLADRLPGDRLFANLPPRDGLGLALRNRLLKAAGHSVTDVTGFSNNQG